MAERAPGNPAEGRF